MMNDKRYWSIITRLNRIEKLLDGHKVAPKQKRRIVKRYLDKSDTNSERSVIVDGQVYHFKV